MKNSISILLARSAALLGFALTVHATLQAATVQFTIDETKSNITLAGKVANFSLQEQGPGSLTTRFSGTLLADVSGSTIQFTGGSAIMALTNGVWEPGPGGNAGSAPANYAGIATIPFIGTAKGALRNLLLDVTSSALTVNNGAFDASGLVFGFPTNSTAAFDYTSSLGKDGAELSGLSTNKIVNGATLSTTNGAQAITIQIDTEFKFTAVSNNDSSVKLTGTLFATQSTSFEITSVQVQGQNFIIRAAGGGASPAVQVSTNLSAWNPQAATPTQENGETVFTIPLSGDQGFFRLTK